MANELVTTTATNNNVVVDDLDNKVMSFFIEDVCYGVDLKNVIEIISIQYITTVPNVPHYIKGIINLRGKIIPIIETRFKLDIEAKEYDDKTCIIIVELDDIQIGLIVDSVHEVMTLANGSTIPAKKEQRDKKYLKGVNKVGNQMVLTLDLSFFINDDNVDIAE
ncbi:MAG: chemotaxis protein CheW [Erysipelotrichales bacterium]|nr:chemotaxis protein CheW [Erysipelotrichales bacterium]